MGLRGYCAFTGIGLDFAVLREKQRAGGVIFHEESGAQQFQVKSPL